MPYGFSKPLEAIIIGGLLLWVGLYVVGMRGPGSRRVRFAQMLVGLSLFCILSTAGQWSTASWASLFGNMAAKMWLVMLLVSTLTLVQSWRMARRENLRVCTSCGYDLWTNTSGKCPECGTDLTAAQKLYLYVMKEERELPDRSAAPKT